MDTIFKTAVDTSLRYARLQVADLARALGFYRDVLGFRVASQEGDQAVLTAQGDTRPILALIERPGARPSHAAAPACITPPSCCPRASTWGAS